MSCPFQDKELLGPIRELHSSLALPERACLAAGNAKERAIEIVGNELVGIECHAIRKASEAESVWRIGVQGPPGIAVVVALPHVRIGVFIDLVCPWQERLFFEIEVLDLECHAVLHDSADSLLIHAIWGRASDFQPEAKLHAGICQMRGHFLQNTIDVSVDADGIKLGCHEEVVGLWGRRIWAWRRWGRSNYPEFPGCFYYHGSNSAEDLY